MDNRKVAVMQPYFFPYIGYFQLVEAVDDFVFYDDVNFIKGGWINRNNILVNGAKTLITVPCVGASPNKKINEVAINTRDKKFRKILQTIKQTYGKAPFFSEIYPIISKTLDGTHPNIAAMAAESVSTIAKYLGLNTSFYFSSHSFQSTIQENRSDRLISIAEQLGSGHYINAIGGQELYDKQYFEDQNVRLNFLKPSIKEYRQFNESFIPGLSIIDVIMFNSKEQVVNMLREFELL